jgi:hypothetical protein
MRNKTNILLFESMYSVVPMKSVILLLLLCLCCFTANAFPDGAGGCEGGKAAVGGPHRTKGNGRIVSFGSLTEGDTTGKLEPSISY